MRRFLTCFLALCCAALLAACEWSAVPLEGDKPPVGSPPEPMEITGQLAEYTEGNVDMALTIPDGWAWETVEEDGQAGLRFRKTDDGAVSFRLTCWLDGYGICGTGVTSTELTLSGGQRVWQHTEAAGDNVWVNIAFQDTPGSYVCMPDDDGVMGSAAWDACRDTVLAILGTARIGRGILTEHPGRRQRRDPLRRQRRQGFRRGGMDVHRGADGGYRSRQLMVAKPEKYAIIAA